MFNPDNLRTLYHKLVLEAASEEKQIQGCGGIAKPSSPPTAAYHGSCPRAQTCPHQSTCAAPNCQRDTKTCDKCNRPPIRPASSSTCQKPFQAAPTCYSRAPFSPDDSSSSSAGMGAMVPYFSGNQGQQGQPGQRGGNFYNQNQGGPAAGSKNAYPCQKRA
ncbi:hypothetical protein WDU94_001420 [Cyamophila willieti]